MLLALLNDLIRTLARWQSRGVTRRHLRRLRRLDPRLVRDIGVAPDAADAEAMRLPWQAYRAVAEPRDDRAPVAPRPAPVRRGAGPSSAPLARHAALR